MQVLHDEANFASSDISVQYMINKISNCVGTHRFATNTVSPKEVRLSPQGANGIKLMLGGDKYLLNDGFVMFQLTTQNRKRNDKNN